MRDLQPWPSALARLRELPPELRNAGIAAAALALSLLLPWYEQSYVPEGAHAVRAAQPERVRRLQLRRGGGAAGRGAACCSSSGRAARSKAFHLPGGDGTAIALAGGWALLLLVWRLFDKPDVADPSSTVGIQWGMFAALLAAGALLATGLRVRAVHRPEPPNPIADEPEPPRAPRPPRRRADPAAVTDVLGERPDWSGEPPEAAGRGAARRHEAPTR